MQKNNKMQGIPKKTNRTRKISRRMIRRGLFSLIFCFFLFFWFFWYQSSKGHLARAGPQGPAIDEIQIFLDFLDLGTPFGKEIPMFGVSGTPLRALWFFLDFLVFLVFLVRSKRFFGFFLDFLVFL